MQECWRAQFRQCPSSSRVILQGTLLWVHETLLLTLLVESGANNSLIKENLARQAGLPLTELSEPKVVLDGHTLAKVTHRVGDPPRVRQPSQADSVVCDSVVFCPLNSWFPLAGLSQPADRLVDWFPDRMERCLSLLLPTFHSATFVAESQHPDSCH